MTVVANPEKGAEGFANNDRGPGMSCSRFAGGAAEKAA
jgi:hypothetical protein